MSLLLLLLFAVLHIPCNCCRHHGQPDQRHLQRLRCWHALPGQEEDAHHLAPHCGLHPAHWAQLLDVHGAAEIQPTLKEVPKQQQQQQQQQQQR
jgi:hypothetical protein